MPSLELLLPEQSRAISTAHIDVVVERAMLRNSLRPLARLARPGGRAFAAVGDAIPDVSLDVEFPPKEVSLKQRLAGRKVILVGLPGAFTPT